MASTTPFNEGEEDLTFDVDISLGSLSPTVGSNTAVTTNQGTTISNTMPLPTPLFGACTNLSDVNVSDDDSHHFYSSFHLNISESQSPPQVSTKSI